MHFNFFTIPIFSFLLLGTIHPLSAQTSITFQVDMSYQIEQGKFNKNTEWVEVAGTFNNWSGSGRFSDEDGDEVYELKIDGFQAAENIAYKFRLNGQWDGREEFPGVGNDRMHTVQNEEAILFHWYNNETPPDAELVADFIPSLREFYEQGIISFTDISSGQVDAWEWTFEGGTPSFSTDKNPVVRYDTPGQFKVALTVKQGDKTSTVSLENYVNVLERNTTNIPWWNETVFYEIFVHSFKDSDGNGVGDFKGLIEKLDYLNDGDPTTTDDLGVTGIWLMPIHEAGSYHGYDVIDYQSVRAIYGGMEDFKTFLDEAHRRGIRVIIDFVINHNSSQSTWFQNAQTGPNAEFRNFYRWSDNNPNYSGPWGQQVWHQKNGDYYYGLFWDGMPDLNYDEPRVKEEIFKAADFWLEDIGIDGFRLDAVKFIVEEDRKLEDTQGTYLFWNEFTEHIKSTKADAFSVGEAWTNTETVVNYVKNDRIDYCFEFDLAGNILYSANEGIADNLYHQLQKMYNIYPHLQYGTFLANHDQNRIMNTFNNDESKVKLAAAIYLTLPGIPYIYYGEEIGMSGAKPDEDIRRPMQWNTTRNAGFTTGTPWRNAQSNYPNYNVEKERADPNSLFNHYKKLIHLRNSEKALQKGSYEPMATNKSQVFAFLRQYEGEPILVVHNTGNNPVSNPEIFSNYPTLMDGNWSLIDLFRAESPKSLSINNRQFSLPITIDGRGTKVYKFTQSVSTQNVDNQSAIKVFPNPVAELLTIYAENRVGQMTDYFIYDLKGSIVLSGKVDLSGKSATISTANLMAGMYHLTLKNEEIIRQVSFVKK